RGASQSTGMAASQVHSHNGAKPVPKKNNAADIARQGAARIYGLSFEAMHKSPQRAMNQFTKFFFRKPDTTRAVEHHVSMHVRPQCKCDLPDIVLLKVTSLHCGGDHVRDRVEGWRAARAKVLRKPSGAWARARENVVKNAWAGESIIYISIQCGSYPGFHSPADRMLQNVFCKLGQSCI